MSGFRPDLVDVWIYRAGESGVEVLMLHRSPGRVMAGLWQGVSGAIEDSETVVAAALREVREETGVGLDAVEAFHHLDYVAQFFWQPADAVVSSVYFALRVGPTTEPVLSHEHDAYRWLPVEQAIASAMWPGYAEGLRRLVDCVLDPARAPWFAVDRGASAL